MSAARPLLCRTEYSVSQSEKSQQSAGFQHTPDLAVISSHDISLCPSLSAPAAGIVFISSCII